jgi:ABC-2 type transport system permease protein
MTSLTGTGTLARLILRRDRLRLAIWTAGVAALVVVSGASVQGLYRTQEDIERYAALVRGNPAVIATSGPGYGFDDPSIGVVLVNETSLWGMISLALMSIFLVARHTRAEEVSGGAELIRSKVVGHHAPSAAALLVVTAANVVIAGVTAAGLLALGFDVTGTLTLCAAFAAVGLVFAALTAALAQVVTTARGTLGAASAVLGAAFALRAAGDIGDGTLSWLSPIGWGQATRPFADERWWVFALCLGVAGLLVAGSFVLESHRDLGGGFIAQRPGPPSAARWLTHPFGLALRLQRGALIGWSIGLFLLGSVYGAVGRDAEQLLADSPEMEEFLLVQLEGASITDSFFAVSFLLLAMIGSGFAISSALRLRSEEQAGRAEPILATSTTRLTWALSHLALALGGAVIVVAAGGLGTGVGYAVATGEPGEVLRLLGASLAYLPPVLVLAGLGAALFGWWPRGAAAAWAALALVVVVGLFAEVLGLPQWARNASPFGHVPPLPAAEPALVPLAALVAVAVGLLGAGLVGFRRRDVG